MTAELVEKVEEERWTNRDGEMVTSYKVTLVDGTGEREVPCYSPMGKDLKEDAPLPDGWEVKTSQKGKLYLAAPKSGGQRGGGNFGKSSSWYNSEEGVRFTQERTDRRCALMQAVVAYGTETATQIAARSDDFYTWLRKNLDVSPGVGQSRETVSSAAGPSAPPRDTPLDGGGDSPIGEAPPSPSINVGRGAGQSLETVSPPDGASAPPGSTCPICGKGWGTTTTSSGKRLCVAGHVERFG